MRKTGRDRTKKLKERERKRWQNVLTEVESEDVADQKKGKQMKHSLNNEILS